MLKHVIVGHALVWQIFYSSFHTLTVKFFLVFSEFWENSRLTNFFVDRLVQLWIGDNKASDFTPGSFFQPLHCNFYLSTLKSAMIERKSERVGGMWNGKWMKINLNSEGVMSIGITLLIKTEQVLQRATWVLFYLFHFRYWILPSTDVSSVVPALRRYLSFIKYNQGALFNFKLKEEDFDWKKGHHSKISTSTDKRKPISRFSIRRAHEKEADSLTWLYSTRHSSFEKFQLL